MIRIGRPVVILLVARVAVRRDRCVIATNVAARTRYGDMETGQRESTR